MYENSKRLLIEQVPHNVDIRTIGMKLEPELKFEDANKFILEKI